MIKIHHLNNSRSQRILWLLEELHLEYEIIHYQRDKETMLAPKELQDIHPLGKSPVLEDGEMIVAESAVIVEYLIKKYGKEETMSYPIELERATKHSYWYHFSEGSMMPPFLLKLVFDKIQSAPIPFFIKPIINKVCEKVLDGFVLPNVKRNLKFVEDALSENDFFMGHELSGADIMMSFPLEAGMSRIENKSDYPKILNFLDTIHQRSSYQAALKKGGEYSYA